MKILEVKLEYSLRGITIGASGARDENSFKDFRHFKKFYDRWAVMPAKLIQLL